MPRKVVAAIMAFGSGVLISALSFELMDDAWMRGGFVAVAIGFIAGASAYGRSERYELGRLNRVRLVT